jgi:transcriptional regulator with XRE-family HTH domain
MLWYNQRVNPQTEEGESMKFSEYFTDLIKKRNMTFQDLFFKTHISAGHLSRIASGKRPPPKPITLRILAEALNTDYVEMMKAAGYIDPETEKAAEKITAKNEQEIIELYREAVSMGQTHDGVKEILEFARRIAKSKKPS